MATPEEARPCRSSSRKLPFSPSPATVSALRLPSSKQVLLHNWWLIKTCPDSHGRRLGIGGFALEGKKRIQSFISAPVVERQDAVTLKTVDGMTVMMHGLLDRSHTLENGFSQEVCDHFIVGFPYDWEEFSTLSSDDNRTSASKDDESSMLKKAFDDILRHGKGVSSAKIGSSPEKTTTMDSIPDKTPPNCRKQKAARKSEASESKVKERTGPLTRSRTRACSAR